MNCLIMPKSFVMRDYDVLPTNVVLLPDSKTVTYAKEFVSRRMPVGPFPRIETAVTIRGG